MTPVSNKEHQERGGKHDKRRNNDTSPGTGHSLSIITDTAERNSWYVLRSGRRFVVPYQFTYTSHVKKRWRGKNILEVMAEEFIGCSFAYLTSAAKLGRILLNGGPVDEADCFRDGDLLSHIVERQEPSVPDEEIRVLWCVGQVLVVHKPAGMPVHPAGRFRRNSLVEVLQAQRPELFLAGGPYVLHRLDRQAPDGDQRGYRMCWTSASRDQRVM